MNEASQKKMEEKSKAMQQRMAEKHGHAAFHQQEDEMTNMMKEMNMMGGIGLGGGLAAQQMAMMGSAN